MNKYHKNSDKKPAKLFLKSSINKSKKISNHKDDKNKNKNNQSSVLNENKKNKEIHENNLKEIESLKEQLNQIEKQNELILREMLVHKTQEGELLDNYNKIISDINSESNELIDLREINLVKNREYLQLLQLRHQQIINEIPRNIDRNQQQNNSLRENINNNIAELDRMQGLLSGLTLLLNILRLRRANLEQRESQPNPNNNNNNNENEENDDDSNDEDPSLIFNKLQSLPSIKYPRNNNTNEKCVICGLRFCYNEKIIKLRCRHKYHKNCLVNRLTTIKSLKCPTCKTSIFNN